MKVRDTYEIELETSGTSVRILSYMHDDGNFVTNSHESERGLSREVIESCKDVARTIYPHRTQLNLTVELE